MSDDLRTRIAAVLGANSHMSRELQDHLADAVIEALIRELVTAEWIRPDWEDDDE